MLRLIVFDWDGTLADSTELIATVLQRACSDVGHPVPELEAARHVIGLGLSDALRHVAPALDREQFPSLAARYRYHYLAREAEIALFDGAREMLHRLAGRDHLLGVATGKTRAGLDRALQQHGLQDVFHATRCADEDAPKPDPAMLLSLMRRLDVAPSDTVMVGDTTHDLEMAQRAGVRAIGVAHGAHARDKLAEVEPVAVVESLEELEDLLGALRDC